MGIEDHIPPNGRSIPFTFSKNGYNAPEEVLFNFAGPGKFGSLKAAVNVMQHYWNYTHTYPKSCPKYVIGYGPGRIQIIRGRCLYGGIRDLQGLIRVWPMKSFPAELVGVLWHGDATFNGIIRAWQREKIGDLTGIFHGWQELDLSSVIGTHLPRNLPAFVRVCQREISDLRAHIHGWQELDLEALIAMHPPKDIQMAVFVQQRELRDMPTRIHAWHIIDLRGIVRGMMPTDLQSYVYPIPAIHLPAYLKVWPQQIIPSYARGWQAHDLGAFLNQMFSYDLPAGINGVIDTFKDLHVRLKGVGSELRDLPAFIRTLHWRLLGGIVRATYLANITAYLFPVLPKDFTGIIHAWHIRNLQGIINGQQYPWNLPASINPVGIWHLLRATISPVKAVGIHRDLRMSIHPWERREFPAYIYGANAVLLSASLTPLGYAKDLHATIRPKMIRLTTVVNIPTFSHRDLSAMINYPCIKTGYSNLMGHIYAKFKGDLNAYIRVIIYDYKPRLLGAKVGYTDSYQEVDKLKLSITVYPNEYFVWDKFKLVVGLLDAKNILGAYINGELTSSIMTATITADSIPKYTYEKFLKNRELVVHKTYDGVFKQFEVVELAFRTAVRDYYYSSAGNYAWKTDRFAKWMLDVRSILPENQALHLKRRLHRATVLYDLRKFISVDEAMKYAIAYVTEHPQANLSASIYNRGRFRSLSGVINPRYIKTTREGLGASITPDGTNIVLGHKSSISKM